MAFYNQKFFEYLKIGALRSAGEIIPIILEFIKPESVIDIGCGIGTWLSIFQEYGITDILGVDGDWIDKNLLLIPEESFLTLDIRKSFKIKKQYDLVVSLEVAEHLPKKDAKQYIENLTALGSIILFSAAIPFQGGVSHLNEQWPEYWIKIFKEKGYIVIDCIRKRIWKNNKIEYWYKQNTFLFIRKDYLTTNDFLLNEYNYTNMAMLSVVHPKQFLKKVEEYNSLNSIFNLIKILPNPILKILDILSKILLWIKSKF